MLYFITNDNQRIIILEPENIEAIKKGLYARSPDKEVLPAYTPDAEWLQDRLIAHAEHLSPELLDTLIRKAHKRPEVRGRAHHPLYEIIKDGKMVGHEG